MSASGADSESARPNRMLVVVAVEREADAVPAIPETMVVVAGVGRTNAAAATTETILRHGPFRGVLSLGIAGALPGSALSIGDAVVASACVYAEEGLAAPGGFQDMRGLRFPLGDFEGNAVPVSPELLARLSPPFCSAPIATVATCSGTDAAADEVARRTGAAAEAMEGAAVVHAARRLGVPGIELRIVSNTTGDRERQQWDLPLAFAALAEAADRALALLSGWSFEPPAVQPPRGRPAVR
ncbi:MAG: futalosine hydrolase [Phycisphaerales bacterium]|nr:futalosine hydrolase [Phycisphaerales bacterium]